MEVQRLIGIIGGSGIYNLLDVKESLKKAIYQYILKDQTGTIPLSSFGTKLPVGKGVRIEGAKLDTFNGYYRLNTYEKTGIENVNLKITEDPEYSYIKDVKTPVGGIKVSGFIISMGEKSGLLTRCKECNTKLFQYIPSVLVQ